MNPFVNTTGCWIYNGDAIEGLTTLARSKTECPILDLSGIELEYLPNCIHNISGLKELYLDNNNLKSLPKRLGLSPNLRLLSLGRNSISELPESISERWNTLEILFLGRNNFTTQPLDEEWMTTFKQGSIGTNPIPEPISSLWMTKQDAEEFPERILLLFPEGASEQTSQSFLEQAIYIIKNCPEPMIYERLFQDSTLQNTKGQISMDWSNWFSTPLLRELGWAIIPFIPRGSLVDPSLINHTLHRNL